MEDQHPEDAQDIQLRLVRVLRDDHHGKAQVPRVLRVVLRPAALCAERLPKDLLQPVRLENEPYLSFKPPVFHPVGLSPRQLAGEPRVALGRAKARGGP